MKTKTIDQFLGERIKERRESESFDWAQEDLAAAARREGIPWTRDHVHAIENGRRDLTIGEFILLPFVFRKSETHPPIHLKTFFEGVDPDQVIRLTEEYSVKAVHLAPLFPVADRYRKPARAVDSDKVKKRITTRDHVTFRAAAKLGFTPEQINDAALKIWKRPLAVERDRRVAADEAAAGGSWSKETRQAKRGHIGRELLAQLEQELNPKK